MQIRQRFSGIRFTGNNKHLLWAWCVLAAMPVAGITHHTSAEPASQPASEPVSEPAESVASQLRVFRSAHYRIHTNLTREETIPFGRHMDAVFEQYQLRFHSFTGGQIEPMPIYLLRTREQYIRFMAGHDIDATNSGGLFFVTHEVQGLATWAESGNRPRTFRVLQHEGFHQFALNYIGPNLPVWINEGLAQYFEDSVIVGQRLAVGLTSPSRIVRVKEAIEDGSVMPLASLAQISSRQWNQAMRDRPQDSAMLYAQSWSLVYYLIHGNDEGHRGAFVEYLKLLSQGSEPHIAERIAFGTDGFAGLTGDWKADAVQQSVDDVANATERLEFLGTGLRLLAENEQDMPESIEDLQAVLQEYGFRVRRQELGVTRQLTADDDTLFTFVRDSDSGNPFEAQFVILAPARSDLPPRIVAPGLSPEPTLIWHRDGDGNLVQDIEYR